MKRTILERIEILESLSNAKKLYSSKIRDGIFQELVSLDPSKTFKYIEKICKFYLEPGTRINDLGSSINLFDTLAKKNLIKIKGINQFKTYSEFKEFIQDNSGKMSKSEERNLIKNEGSEVILNNSDFLVLLIKNEQASIQYGSGTKWCIAARDDNYFKSYRRDWVTFYFIFQKNLPSSNPNYKIAVAVYPSGDPEVFLADDSMKTFSVISKLGLDKDLFKPLKLDNNDILEACILGTYSINSKGEIDVEGDVRLHGQKLFSILDVGQFGTVTGLFDCALNKLKNLEGSPREVGGAFLAMNNELKTLKGCPERINGDFLCYGNDLTSLTHAPKYVKGKFKVNSNELKTLEEFPEFVGGDIWIQDNKLRDLEFLPSKVTGNLYCDLRARTDLQYLPEVVKKDLVIYLAFLGVSTREVQDYCDENVGYGDLIIQNTKIEG